MSAKIPCITVYLVKEQIEEMAPIRTKIMEASATGAQGMLLAQIFGDTMRVFFADHTQAEGIQAAMGSRVGRTTADP